MHLRLYYRVIIFKIEGCWGIWDGYTFPLTTKNWNLTYRISKIVLNSKWSTYCPFIIFVFGLLFIISRQQSTSQQQRGADFQNFFCLCWLHNYLIPTTTTGTDNGPYILVFLRRDFHHKIFLLYILFYVLVPVNEKYHQMSPSVIE